MDEAKFCCWCLSSLNVSFNFLLLTHKSRVLRWLSGFGGTIGFGAGVGANVGKGVAVGVGAAGVGAVGVTAFFIVGAAGVGVVGVVAFFVIGAVGLGVVGVIAFFTVGAVAVGVTVADDKAAPRVAGLLRTCKNSVKTLDGFTLILVT